MNHIDIHHPRHARSRWSIPTAAAAALSLALSLTLAGCSAAAGSGDDSGGGTGTGSGSAAGAAGGPAAWGACMRDKGFQVEDPDAESWAKHITRIPDGADEEGFTTASETCRGDEDRVSDTEKDEFAQQLRDYSACMREHGVTDFPEPDDQGGLDFGKYGQAGAADSPGFTKADEICHAEHLADWGQR